jgi:hypothetical protein
MKTTKRAFQVVGVCCVTISVIRVLVLFSESYSLVRAERAADAQLLNVCREQEAAASASAKFRSACLAARSDSAAPVLLKALLRAVHTAFTDFIESFNSPTKIIILVLFVLSGLSAPVIKVVAKTFLAGLAAGGKGGKDHGSDSDSDDEGTPRILMLASPTSYAKANGFAQLTRRIVRRAPSVGRVEELDEDGVTVQVW